MSTDRRTAAATAGVGYSLVGAGAVMRGHSIDNAHTTLGRHRRMIPPVRAVYEARGLPGAPARLRRLVAGTALVTAGAPAAAKGTADLLHRRKVNKRDHPHSLVREGLQGTGQAWRDKAQGFRSGAPMRVRAVPVAVGAGAGAAGSLAAHRTLDLVARRRVVPARLRHAATAAAAVPAVVASLPLSRRITRRHGYTPQASGGLKPIGKAVDPARAHRLAVDLARKGRLPEQRRALQLRNRLLQQRRRTTPTPVGKLYIGPDYQGRHVSRGQQRLRTYAAGQAPVIGPAAAIRQAGRYAPPGHQRAAMARQAAGGSVAAYAGGAAGAYGLAHLAEHSPTIARHTERAAQAGEDVKAKVLRRPAKKAGEVPKLLRGVADSRLGAPLFGNRRRAIGALVGYAAGKTIGGQVGGNVAVNRNYAAQRRFDAKHTHTLHNPFGKTISKLVEAQLSAPQAKTLARRKRRSAHLSEIGGSLGLTALGLQLASRRPHQAAGTTARLLRHRDTALTAGAGVSGINAMTTAAIQRREAKTIHKDLARAVFLKAVNGPRTTMTDEEAHRLVHGRGGYGLTGSLPHQLDRSERMRAYEARYLTAGGRKREHWARRARTAEVARNVGVAGGTVAGAAWLAAGSPRLRRLATATRAGSRLAGKLTEHRVKSHAERAAVGAATLAGASELSGEYARHKRGTYSSAPAGVAASALRRMQNYSP